MLCIFLVLCSTQAGSWVCIPDERMNHLPDFTHFIRTRAPRNEKTPSWRRVVKFRDIEKGLLKRLCTIATKLSMFSG